MKVRIAIFVLVIAGASFGIHKVNEFRNSPTGKVIEQIQEKKQLMRIYKNHQQKHSNY